MPTKKWQSKTLRLLGSAVLLFAIFWFIPFTDVIAALKKVDLGFAAAGMLMMLATGYIDAVALWVPLHKIGVPGTKWQIFEIKMITRFYAQFLPSELMASAVKLHRLAAATGQWGEVTAALAFCRVVSMLVLVSLGLTLWAIEMPPGPGRFVGYILGAMAMALLVAHFTIKSPRATAWGKRVLGMRAFDWLQGKLFDKVMALARTMVTSYRLFGDAIYPVIAFALARHLLGIVSFMLVALALDLHISFMTVGWIRVVMAALLMLPISMAGIGVREGGLVVLLQAYSVSPNDAVALAFLLFIVQVLSNAIGGVFEVKNLLGLRRDPAGVERPSE